MLKIGLLNLGQGPFTENLFFTLGLGPLASGGLAYSGPVFNMGLSPLM